MLLLALSLLGLAKSLLLAALAALNGLLALLAAVSVWRAYLVVGTKLLLTVLLLVPVVGLVVYLLWGQRKVREAR